MINALELKGAYSKRYSLVKASKEVNSFKTGVPQIVVEKEAKSKGLSVDEFIQQYELECLFNNFDGLHYNFVLKPEKVTVNS